jgi:AAT family amino acid transporter/GABA permease/proline-specific permease ProY
MLGFGSVIGAGLFVASGAAVKAAGPAVLLAFLIGAVAFFGVLSGLAEMATANPAHGGLRTYAREALGPWMGFTVGWMYWSSGVLTMSAEVTAAALLAHQWLPRAPLWSLCLAFAAGVTAINFLGARGFGRVEGGLSIIKVLALVLFVVGGGALLLRGGAPGRSVGGFLPNGTSGFFSSLLLVMVTYAGVQVVAMAAPETSDPPRMVPQAVRWLTVSVVALYLSAFTVLVLLLPPAQINLGTSPFVQALGGLRLPWLNAGFNLVILTAALSSLNSALFSVSRMLRALATDGQAPRIFLRSSGAGIPAWALAGSAIMLMIGVILSFVLPHQAYLLITSASGFTAMFNWAAISLCHLRYRPLLEARGPLPFRAWGFPYLPLATLGVVAMVMGTTLLARTQLIGLAVGTTQFLLVSSVYFLAFRQRRAVAEAPNPRPVLKVVPTPLTNEDDDDRLPT